MSPLSCMHSFKSIHALFHFFFLRMGPPNTEAFLTVYGYVGKGDLIRGFWNPKRKLGVTKHFREITKQQSFLKALKYKTVCGIFSRLKLNYL